MIWHRIVNFLTTYIIPAMFILIGILFLISLLLLGERP